MSLISFLNMGWRRWRTHGLLALFTLLGCEIIHLYSPYADLNYILTLACGYVSLIFIVISLLIGPYKLLYQRRNPVNLNLRRDVGIWAGINGCIHVLCVFLIRPSSDFIYLFLRPKAQGIGYDLLLSPQVSAITSALSPPSFSSYYSSSRMTSRSDTLRANAGNSCSVLTTAWSYWHLFTLSFTNASAIVPALLSY